MGIVILSFIGIIVVIVLCTIRHFRNLRTDFVAGNSMALLTLQAINAKYDFLYVPCFDMAHDYDNIDYYDTISPEDYLIYQLIYKQNAVQAAIRDSELNRSKTAAYYAEISSDCTLGNFIDHSHQEHFSRFEKAVINHWLKTDFDGLCAVEKELLDKETKRPVTSVNITVTLYRTDLSGRVFSKKSTVFTTLAILNIIEQLRNKSNGFYSNPALWQAICRVERGRVSNKLRFAIYKRDGNRCRKCQSPYNLEIDHIFPISKGGKSVPENLQTLCHNCNTQKSNTIERSAIVLHGPQDHPHGFCIYCGIPLVKRHGKYGDFFGCPNYPKCKYTSK